MTDDEITQAFESITIDDFVQATSALSERQANTGPGREGLERFFWALLNYACHTYEADGVLIPTATLEANGVQRLFMWEGDETHQMLADRLRREAAQMRATKFFIAIVLPFGHDPEGDVERGLAQGTIRDVITCYARSVEPDYQGEMTAIVDVHDDNTLGDPVMLADFDFFRDVLN